LVLRPSPFGVIVGAALLVAAVLPLVVPPAEPAALNGPTAAEVERLREQVQESEQRADELAAALEDANDRLAAAGQPPVVPTTVATSPGSAPHLPQDGQETTAAVSHPGGTTGATEPPVVTTATTTPVLPTTPPSTSPPSTAPPTTAPPTTEDDGCPAGYHPVFDVTVPPIGARVCVKDH
jgi:hypothetical protein